VEKTHRKYAPKVYGKTRAKRNLPKGIKIVVFAELNKEKFSSKGS